MGDAKKIRREIDANKIRREIMTKLTVPLWPTAGRRWDWDATRPLRVQRKGKSRRLRLGAGARSLRRSCAANSGLKSPAHKNPGR